MLAPSRATTMAALRSFMKVSAPGAAALALGLGCARHRGADAAPAMDPVVVEVQACAGVEEGTCLPAPLRAPPVVVGPGRVRVLTDDWASPATSAFRVTEITHDGARFVVAGRCPEQGDEMSLGRLADGASAVLCHSFRAVHFGVVDERLPRIEWRWRQPLPDWTESRISAVPYFVDLGPSVVLFLEIAASKGSTAGWNTQLAPSALPADSLCMGWCKLAALVVTGEKLHTLVLRGNGQGPQEVTIDAKGIRTASDPLKAAQISPGELGEPCVSEDQDGTVTVRLGEYRQLGSYTPNLPLLGESTVATVRYEHAWLAHGPDVFPTERLFCTPRLSLTSSAPTSGDFPTLRKWPRVTLDGEHGLLVYGQPNVDPTNSPGMHASYAGSVRIARFSAGEVTSGQDSAPDQAH